MLEGLLVSILIAYVSGWTVLKCVYWYDARQAHKLRIAREKRHMELYGRVKSPQEIMDEAKANILWGWDS